MINLSEYSTSDLDILSKKIQEELPPYPFLGAGNGIDRYHEEVAEYNHQYKTTLSILELIKKEISNRVEKLEFKFIRHFNDER